MKATVLWLVVLSSTVAMKAQSNETGWGDKVQYQLTIDALFQKGTMDPGASFTAWYFVKEKIGLGPSVSYRRYNTILKESMINTGMEAIFLSGSQQSAVRTYGAFQSGIGFPVLGNTAIGSTSSLSSRLFVQPRIGLFIDTGRSSAVNVSLAYIHQGLDISFEQAQSDINLNYNRYIVSIGLAF